MPPGARLPTITDYDVNDNGLIEVSNLDQLNAIRWDLDGDGDPAAANTSTYLAAFPDRIFAEIRFYTGVPNPGFGLGQKFWPDFWANKLRPMQNRGIHVYRGRVNVGGQEKGVDVSLAIDLVQATYEQRYEVAIIVSQDTDFGPAVRLAKTIARNQSRQLVYESAFPAGPGRRSPRGVPGTPWVPIDQATYDACLDPADYHPKRS